jgi:hypothetical protein
MAVPIWHVGLEEAPISPNKAVAIPNDDVRSHLGVQNANVLRIYIRPLRSESDDRWKYDINYTTGRFPGER